MVSDALIDALFKSDGEFDPFAFVLRDGEMHAFLFRKQGHHHRLVEIDAGGIAVLGVDELDALIFERFDRIAVMQSGLVHFEAALSLAAGEEGQGKQKRSEEKNVFHGLAQAFLK